MRLKLFLILGKSEARVLKKIVLKKKRVYIVFYFFNVKNEKKINVEHFLEI